MSAFVLKENKAIDEKYYYAKHKSGLPIYVIPKNHTTGYAVFGTNFGSAVIMVFPDPLWGSSSLVRSFR